MDIRHLRTFVAVARLGSVTRAAESLHLSQPAISGQLKRLEETLEVRLLNRSTVSLSLTPAGEALLDKAEAALDRFGDFVHSARALRGDLTGQLRIGVPLLDVPAMQIDVLVDHLSARHPSLRLELQSGRIAWLRDALRSAEIDVALLVCRAPPPGMRVLPLRRLVYRVSIPSSWSVQCRDDAWSALGHLPWIRPTPDSAHDELTRELFASIGISPPLGAQADHEALVAALVEAGAGAALLREEIACAGAISKRLALVGNTSLATTLSLVWPLERDSDPVIDALRQALAGIWHSHAGKTPGSAEPGPGSDRDTGLLQTGN